MPYPPPGHPHYIPDEVRAATAAAAAKAYAISKGYEYDDEEDPIDMTTSAAAQKYSELRSKIAEARKIMEETAKGLFNEMADGLFKENSALQSFSWTQYTPYFNDGDECVFRSNGSYPTVSMIVDGDVLGYDSNSGEFTVNGDEEESVDSIQRKFRDLGVDEFKKNGRTYAYDKKTNTITVNGEKVKTYEQRRALFEGLEKVVAKFLDAFEDEDMKTMFGDHMRVTVNRDGNIETEEYQHD